MKRKVTEKATHSGELRIGSLTLLCHVLEDGTRVVSQSSINTSLKLTRTSNLSKFISNGILKEYVNDELRMSVNNPIIFKRRMGGNPTFGYKATILVDICDIILQANKENVLMEDKKHVVQQAEILIRSFAKVGIVALIDEATGYQEVRQKDALQKILDAYLSKELSAWAKRFPDDFYKEIFRLKGWPYNQMSVKRPSCVGNYTQDIVYRRLAPEILKELEKKNPKDDKGRRKHTHHQFLTQDIGHPALAQHLYGAIGLMRTQQTWDQFMRLLNRAYPIKIIDGLFE